jgi:hypothetical protein
MKSSNIDPPLWEKIKASEHWREDFEIIEVEDVGGIKVYRVKANDQEASTMLAIARLNEVLRS